MRSSHFTLRACSAGAFALAACTSVDRTELRSEAPEERAGGLRADDGATAGQTSPSGAASSEAVAAGAPTKLTPLEPAASDANSPSVTPLGSSAGSTRAPACDGVRLTPAGQTALRRWPYVQNVTDHSATILFKLTAARATALSIVGPSGSSRKLEPAPDPQAADGLQRVVVIEGLQPGTTYCYSLAGLTEPIRLRTAVPPASSAAVRFAVFGDSGSGTPDQLSVRSQLETFAFDLMLHTGDVAYEAGRLDELERNYFAVYAPLLASIPMFPALGNHDYETEDGAPFREVFELPDNGVPGARERWYSFDWGDVHFVALDTERVGAEQTKWLDRDLTANQLPWVVAYMHRPPYSSGAHGNALDVQASFVPLFERHHVQIVFGGHEHDYERMLPIGGVTYVVTGGGGRYLRSITGGSLSASSESVFHFVYVEVLGNTLQLHAVDNARREFDAVTLTR